MWHPIETAPADTPVLIWDGHVIATAERYEWLTHGGKTLSDWRVIGSGDCSCGYCDAGFRGENPTHWMTLPEPPL